MVGYSSCTVGARGEEMKYALRIRLETALLSISSGLETSLSCLERASSLTIYNLII
jgi:hypothetical protein